MNYKIFWKPDDSDNGFFLEVDLYYPDKIKEKTKCSLFGPKNKVSPQDKISD